MCYSFEIKVRYIKMYCKDIVSNIVGDSIKSIAINEGMNKEYCVNVFENMKNFDIMVL